MSSLPLLPDVGLVDLADPALPERLAGEVSEQLEAFASKMPEGLLAASVAIGLDVMGELVDAEVTEVAGLKGRHDPDRRANRHGTEDGKVTLGGCHIPVRRPRVRSVPDDDGVEHDVHLESCDTFASVDLLAEPHGRLDARWPEHVEGGRLLGDHGSGVQGQDESSRRYQRALVSVGETVESVSSGTSQSAVSRRFITAIAERIAEFHRLHLSGWLLKWGRISLPTSAERQEFRSRPLDYQRWLIVFCDGFDFAGHSRPQCEALARRRHAAALGGCRHGRRLRPVRRVKGYRQLPQLAKALQHPSAPRPRRPSLSPHDHMIRQEAATNLHGRRVILPSTPEPLLRRLRPRLSQFNR